MNIITLLGFRKNRVSDQQASVTPLWKSEYNYIWRVDASWINREIQDHLSSLCGGIAVKRKHKLFGASVFYFHFKVAQAPQQSSRVVTSTKVDMVSLKLQKRLAASVLQCGTRKIWMDPNEVRRCTPLARGYKHGFCRIDDKSLTKPVPIRLLRKRSCLSVGFLLSKLSSCCLDRRHHDLAFLSFADVVFPLKP